MSDSKKEPSRYDLGSKIKNSPLVSITIILGIVGLLFPLLGWILDVTNPIQSQDLEKVRDDLANIQKVSQDIQKAMNRIIETADKNGSIQVWHLNDYERDILKKLGQGKRNPIATTFSVFVFSLQGAFFILVGILLERKTLAPSRQTLKKKETQKMPSISEANLKAISEVKPTETDTKSSFEANVKPTIETNIKVVTPESNINQLIEPNHKSESL